jgi:hypothetical protein
LKLQIEREKRESGIRMEVKNSSKLTHEDGSRGEKKSNQESGIMK